MTAKPNEFLWVGNHPGLDLVNTAAVDGDGDPLELVPDWPALIDWARSAGLIDDELARECRATSDREARTVLPWFRRLRSALRAVLERGDEPDAATALAAAVGAVRIRLTYRPDRPTAGPLDASGPLERLRLTLAIAALDATRLERSRVRRCGSPRCVLLYYDTTKNRSRRWCDMAVCGNRAKATAHYRRAKQSALAR
jgi:predicted RNA-binding Zn ribbon-like protein